jgi:tRNA-Thr(GGU) m(6)t(6)A37 methyltransferase TsaA
VYKTLGFKWLKQAFCLASAFVSVDKDEPRNPQRFIHAIVGRHAKKNRTMSDILIKPIGFVTNNRIEPIDDNWSSVESVIELADDLPDECFDGIEEFSHLEIIYHFDKSTKTFIGSEHPRENKDYPKVGIFAQRKKDRPNHIGATIVNLIRRDCRKLIVKNLDAINGTPIIDIKPVFNEYLPKGDVKQPKWTNDLMKNYW